MNTKQKIIYYGKCTLLFLIILVCITYTHLSCSSIKTPWQPKNKMSHKRYKHK